MQLIILHFVETIIAGGTVGNSCFDLVGLYDIFQRPHFLMEVTDIHFLIIYDLVRTTQLIGCKFQRQVIENDGWFLFNPLTYFLHSGLDDFFMVERQSRQRVDREPGK